MAKLPETAAAPVRLTITPSYRLAVALRGPERRAPADLEPIVDTLVDVRADEGTGAIEHPHQILAFADPLAGRGQHFPDAPARGQIDVRLRPLAKAVSSSAICSARSVISDRTATARPRARRLSAADRPRVARSLGCRCSCRRRRRPARPSRARPWFRRSASSRRPRSNSRRATRIACDRFRRPWTPVLLNASVRRLLGGLDAFAAAVSISAVCAASRASSSLRRPSRNFSICRSASLSAAVVSSDSRCERRASDSSA